MQQSLGESLVVREVPCGWGPFRFAATPRVWLRSADGARQEIRFPGHWGWTAGEAEARARQALDAWKRRNRKWRT